MFPDHPPPLPAKVEGPFGATRMPFGEHLEELRRCLLRALVGFALIVALVFALDLVGILTRTDFGIGRPVMLWICGPVEEEVTRFRERRRERLRLALQAGDPDEAAADAPREVPLELPVRELAAALGLSPSAPPEGEGRRYVRLPVRIPPLSWELASGAAADRAGRRPGISTLSVTEGMTVYFQVALACGFVLGAPWTFGQLWLFVAAGLYPQERKHVHRLLPFSVALFLGGVALCQLCVMPRTVEALLWFNQWFDWEPEIRLREWLGFAVLMPLVFGLSFQTPLVMLFLERVGLFGADAYRRQRRLAWFLLIAFAAVLTPSSDLSSLLWLCVPMGLLYELGIVLCGLREASRGRPPGGAASP